MNDKVKRIKQWALANYDKGGDVIVETFEDTEIDQQFASLAAAQRFCKRYREHADEIRSTAF